MFIRIFQMVILTKINKLLQQFSEWCDLSEGKKLKRIKAKLHAKEKRYL